MSTENNRPNVVLIVVEHHRGDWTEFNPNLPISTPNIKELGEKGVYFSNALCPSPLCVPSRVCLATGREYDNCAIVDNRQCYPLHQTSFYELLRETGYHTMMCGKYDFLKPFHAFRPDGLRHYSEEYSYLIKKFKPTAQKYLKNRDFMDLWGISDGIDSAGKFDGVKSYKRGAIDPYVHYLKSKNLADAHVQDYRKRGYFGTYPCPLPQEDYCDDWIHRQALKLLRRSPEKTPWFIQINFNGAHNPWDITEEMHKKIQENNPRYPPPVNAPFWRKKASQKVRQNYGAQIENIDRLLGELVEYLKETQQFENTLIMLIGDHGEMLLDHNGKFKRFPYHPSVNVPFLISGLDVEKRGVVPNAAESLDAVGTILDYAGIPIPQEMDCLSLRPWLEGKQENLPRTHAISGFHNWRLVFDGRYKLICGFKPLNCLDRLLSRSLWGSNQKLIIKEPLALFDLEKDPHEKTNIAEENPAVVDRLLREFLIIPEEGHELFPKNHTEETCGSCERCKALDRLVFKNGRYVCETCD